MSNSKLKAIVEQLVKQELSSILSEKTEPEAPADAEFGQYLFGINRKDTPAKLEPNTPVENTFEKALDAHVTRNMSGQLVNLIPQLLDLKNSGYYAKYLQPPKRLVYRFVTNLPVEHAANMIGVEVEELINYKDKVTSTEEIPHSYTPRKQIASWTTDPQKLEDTMFTRYPKHNTVIVLLVADTTTSGDFLLNPTKLSKVTSSYVADYLSAENEVISAGEVQIVKAAFMYNENNKYVKDYFSQMLKAVK